MSQPHSNKLEQFNFTFMTDNNINVFDMHFRLTPATEIQWLHALLLILEMVNFYFPKTDKVYNLLSRICLSSSSFAVGRWLSRLNTKGNKACTTGRYKNEPNFISCLLMSKVNQAIQPQPSNHITNTWHVNKHNTKYPTLIHTFQPVMYIHCYNCLSEHH